MPDNIEKVAIPSLSADSWIFSSLRQADYVMAYFLASDYSQSYLFNRQISSFGYLVAIHNNNIGLLISEITRALESLFGRYFNSVHVECTDATKETNPSKVILALFVEFQMQDGTISNISKLAQIKGSKFKIINDAITIGN